MIWFIMGYLLILKEEKMGIFEVVKKGFTTTSKLMNVVLVFFVFNVIIGLLSIPIGDPANAGKPGVVAASITMSVIFFLIFIFMQGGAMAMVRDQIKSGSAALSKFGAYGKSFYLRILGLLLLYVLIAIAVVLVLALLSAGLLLLGDNLVIRSIVAAIVTVVALAVIVFLIYPIYTIVAEDQGPIMAFRKGVVVGKENFMKTLAVFIIMLLVSLLISIILGFIAGAVTLPLGATGGRVVLAIVNAAIQSYIPIVMMAAFMALYLSFSGKKI